MINALIGKAPAPPFEIFKSVCFLDDGTEIWDVTILKGNAMVSLTCVNKEQADKLIRYITNGVLEILILE